LSSRVVVTADAATAIVSDVVEYIFERYPYVARRAGRHDFDGRVPEVYRRSSADFGHLRTAVTRQLNALPEHADADLRADLDTCLKVLEHESFRVEKFGQVYPGVLDWIYEADVAGYLGSPYAPLEERVWALRTHLAQLPPFLGHAIRTLGSRLPVGERLGGLELARAQADNIRSVVRQLTLERPDLGTPLATVAAEAAAACEEYAAAIEAKEPVKELLGPELLADLLLTSEGIGHPVADLIAEAEAEIAALTSELGKAAVRLGVEHPRAAYDLLLDHIPRGTVLESLKSIIEGLKEFWTAQNILPVRTAHPLEFRGASQIARSAEVTFIIAPPLEKVRQAHLLYVPEPPKPTGSGRAGGVWDYLNEPMLELLAVHEAYAGHYVQVETALNGPSVIRNSVFWFSGFTEGWAHYIEELAIERGLAHDRPLVAVAQLRFALEAATRLLVYLSVQTGRWTFAEARDHAARLCHWSLDRATREVLETSSNGGRAMYALGKLRIREWRRSAGVGASGPGLTEFHELLMRCGSAPLSTTWRYYLDRRSGCR
jgi:hypothetical protein